MSSTKEAVHDEAVAIRLLAAADAALFEAVAEDVFDEATDRSLTAEFLADPRHHIAAAIADGVIVGFASGVHYMHPDKPAELWINEAGVAPAYQRRGIGRKLLQALLEHGRALGCREAWVLTEEDNAAARGLYRAAGGEESRVVYFTFGLEAEDAT